MNAADPLLTPAELVGVWRRTELRLKGVLQPDDQDVYWVQAAGGFGDIRVPKTPIDLARGQAATVTQSKLLAEQDAFAGTISLSGGICRWHREIAFHHDAPPDEAELHLVDDTLYEAGLGPVGTDADYHEIFRRQIGPEAQGWVFRNTDDTASRRAICVVLDDMTFFARARSEIVPTTDAHSTQAVLGCDAFLAQAGQITLATYPWRRGQRLDTCLRQISQTLIVFEEADEGIALHATETDAAGDRHVSRYAGAVS